MKKRRGVITHYHWRKKRILILIVSILFLFLFPALVLMVSVFGHVKYLGVESEKYPLQYVYMAKELKLTEIEHTLTTQDGQELWCSEIKADRPEAVIIYLTARKEPSVTYFYGHAAWMQKKNYSSFLLEVRGHGKSSGSKVGLGYDEVEDVRALVDYIKSVKEYKKLPIVIQGVEMGAAIAINAAGQIPEIDGCIAVSPYASYDDYLNTKMKQYYIPGFLRFIERPVLHQALRILYGKDKADNMTPVKQIENLEGRQIMLISAMADSAVPTENTVILQAAKPDAQIWLRDSDSKYAILDNDFENIEKDSEYCANIATFISRVVRSR